MNKECSSLIEKPAVREQRMRIGPKSYASATSRLLPSELANPRRSNSLLRIRSRMCGERVFYRHPAQRAGVSCIREDFWQGASLRHPGFLELIYSYLPASK